MHDIVENLSVMFSTGRPTKPWHFHRCERHLSRGTHDLRKPRCSQQPVLSSEIRQVVLHPSNRVNQHIHRRPKTSFRRSEPPSHTNLRHSSRPSWWHLRLGSQTLPPAVVLSPLPPVISAARVAAEGPGFHVDPPSYSPLTPRGFQVQNPRSVMNHRRSLPFVPPPS